MSKRCLVVGVLALAGMAGAAPPGWDHIVVVIEENHGASEILGNSAAPYINDTLGSQGAEFDSVYAFLHTSAPNYGELFSGSANGINDTAPPPAPLTAPNLAAELPASGYSFASYAEDLPATGSRVFTAGSYVRRHNPSSFWQDDSPGASPNALPSSVNQPMTSFPTDYSKLPTVSFVIPNLTNDMHDGTDPTRITTADTWMKDNLDGYYQWAKTHNSLLIMMFDEDSIKPGNYNRTPMIMAGANVQHTTSSVTYTLHNFLRTIEDGYGLPHAGASQYVRPIEGIYAGDPTPTTLTFRNGVNGYAGQHDTQVRQDTPDGTFGATTTLVVDADDNTSAGNQASQAMIRFDGFGGAGPALVPAGATVLSAKMIIHTGSASGSSSADPVTAQQMTIPWDETATWNSLGGGIRPGVNASAAVDFAHLPQVLDHPFIVDVSNGVQGILDGSVNNGWALLPTSIHGWRFDSGESSTIPNRPGLEITYITVPRWAASAGGNWGDAANWYNGIPDAAGTVVYLPGKSGAITLDRARTVGRLNFEAGNTQTISGGTLVLDGGGAAAQINAADGSHQIASPVQVRGDLAVYAPGGMVTMAGPLALTTAGATITVRAGALAYTIASGASSIAAGTTLVIEPGAAVVAGGSADPFSGGGGRMAVENDSLIGLSITAGQKSIAALTGIGNTAVGDGATLTSDAIRQNALSLSGSAIVHVRPGAGPSVVNSLSLAGAAQLDLANNDLIVRYPAPTAQPDPDHSLPLEKQLRQWVANWAALGNGQPRIESSIAAKTTFAVFDNAREHWPTLHGVALDDPDEIIVKCVYLGDANLDGRVDPTDYLIVDSHINRGSNGQDATWDSGDLDYSGVVDPGDYLQIDGNIGAGDGATGGPQLGIAPVPEPGWLFGVFLGMAGICRRRARRRN